MTKAPTLQDVARTLGMHKSTVSLALSGKGTISADTRIRVVRTAQEMGYEPDPVAQRLAHGHGQSTVCLFSGVLDVGLTTEKILLVQRALTARGLDVPIYTCCDLADGDAPASAERSAADAQALQVRQLCRQRPRAIVCAAQKVHAAVFRELEAYQRSGGLIISYDTAVPLECDQVIFDREDNACQAARRLLEAGHRRIGIGMSQVSMAAGSIAAGGGGADKRSDPQALRLQGFRRALAEYGVTPREDWFFRNATYEKGGAAMARQFLAMSDRPTAVAIVNDYVALAFMIEVMRAGVRVPEDLSIIGHDDQPIAEYCPVPLSSMTQPAERIASAVADLLLERLSDDSFRDAPPRTVVIRSEFVSRESLAPCKDAVSRKADSRQV